MLSPSIFGIYVLPIAATKASNPQGKWGEGNVDGKWHPRVRIPSIFASIKRIRCLVFVATSLFIRANRTCGERDGIGRKKLGISSM